MKNNIKDDKYLTIADHYGKCLQQYGDSHRGVDWPRAEDANKRYQIMLDVFKKDPSENITLLDFGCGTSHLFGYMQQKDYKHIQYSGLEILNKFVETAQKKYPQNTYYCLDILTRGTKDLPAFDYIVMNGVFTQKLELPFEEMFCFLKDILEKIFPHTKKGIAFNVMSKQVDWEQKGNFYLGFDVLGEYLTKHLSRNFIIRHDYGLYEYTVYVYK